MDSDSFGWNQKTMTVYKKMRSTLFEDPMYFWKHDISKMGFLKEYG